MLSGVQREVRSHGLDSEALRRAVERSALDAKRGSCFRARPRFAPVRHLFGAVARADTGAFRNGLERRNALVASVLSSAPAKLSTGLGAGKNAVFLAPAERLLALLNCLRRCRRRDIVIPWRFSEILID